jgi:hypothetical protein
LGKCRSGFFFPFGGIAAGGCHLAGFRCIFFGSLLVVGKLRRGVALLSGLLVGSALAVWVQSQILIWNFGPLDGRGMNWEGWRLHAYGELAIWSAAILFGLYVFLRRQDSAYRLTTNALLILGVISIILAYFDAPETVHVDRDEMDAFTFHPTNNVVVVLLDTFQSDYFDRILEDYPNEAEPFDGFTFYRNTISSYPTTAPNIPAIFTRREYRNEVPFKEFVQNAYESFDLAESFLRFGYEVKSVGASTLPNIRPGALTMETVLQAVSVDRARFALLLLDYGLFRALPTALKPYVYRNGDWLVSFGLRGDYPPDFHGVDLRFLSALESHSSLSAGESNGSFSFFHFAIPHSPWRVNENLAYDPSLIGESGYLRQARGALKLTGRILDKLRSLGIYDSSEIFVISDHGTLSIPPLSRGERWAPDFHEVPTLVQSSALALFLHKPASHAAEGLKIDDAPLQLKDFVCFTKARTDDIACDDFDDAMAGRRRVRTFLFYDWKHENWQSEYLPAMTEYLVSGHAYDPASWRQGDVRYHLGERQIMPRPQLEIGQPILFERGGNASQFLRLGWSGQEATHRWTDGPIAALVLPLSHAKRNDLYLRFDLSPYTGGGLSHQMVTVEVNGAEIARWRVSGRAWYEAAIPKSVAGEGDLHISFVVSDPTAPCSVEESNDCRALGLSARELIITDG